MKEKLYPIAAWFKFNGSSKDFQAGFTAASKDEPLQEDASADWKAGYTYEQNSPKRFTS